MITMYSSSAVYFCVQYMRLVDRVSCALSMPALPADVNLDCAINAIIDRAEHLVHSQTTHDADASSLVHALRHKIKKLKEKLSDKVFILVATIHRGT